MELINVISEISINYNPKIKASVLLKIETSKDAENYFRFIWSNRMQYVEECYILLLNRANKVLGFSKISLGGTISAIVDVKVIFQTALKANAHGIILAHNHPSGALKASKSDVNITHAVHKAGKVMEIALLDHLIITEESCYSFADEGILPTG